jgi:hypothetical protein
LEQDHKWFRIFNIGGELRIERGAGQKVCELASFLGRCQANEEEPNTGEINPGFLGAGEPFIVYAQAPLSSIALTLDIYSHVTPRMHQEAADTMHWIR